ncbi:MAG TPA: DUF4350 domain-containing protein [Acidothermaceae bacterium]|jgi:hypothetical protein
MTALDELTTTSDNVPIRAGHSADLTTRQRWRRSRVLVGAGVVLVIGAIVVALGSGKTGKPLDPQSYSPSGTHALSVLLAQRGVHVLRETDAATAVDVAVPGMTLVVVSPQLLSTDELTIIASSRADLVVVGAGLDETQALSLPLATQPDDGNTLRQPSCSLRAATVAGSAQLKGGGYTVPNGGQGCYPDGGDGFALVTFATSGHRVTLLSDGTPLMNSSLGNDGNAALALGLLDTHADVVWLVPPQIAPVSSTSGGASVESLLPSRLKWAFLQLVIAVIVIAIWRGRRLGRLVPEDLPVVVRQSETVRGRSRLYRRSHSLDTAAEALRDGARARLGHRLGLGLRPQPQALVQAVAARVGQPAAQVEALLYGSTPADDPTLVTLAQALTALEQEVLRT